MALTQVSRSYKSAADKFAAGYELSQATVWPVIMIARLGGCVRPGQLADALGLEPSSIVRLIDHLVDAGLVKRSEDASDRRARALRLTSEGKRRAVQLEKALVIFRRELFQGMPESDVKACLRVLHSLGAAVDGYEARANAKGA
ncbi:MarR family winged helix-turn-helix transcriptional regulator [Paucimonas lemoignei]